MQEQAQLQPILTSLPSMVFLLNEVTSPFTYRSVVFSSKPELVEGMCEGKCMFIIWLWKTSTPLFPWLSFWWTRTRASHCWGPLGPIWREFPRRPRCKSMVGKLENFTDICCLMIISYTLMLSYIRRIYNLAFFSFQFGLSFLSPDFFCPQVALIQT